MERFLAGIGIVLGLLLVALQFGWFVPVVKTHCVAEGTTSLDELEVDSGWEFTGLRLDPWGDSETCVYNTLTREGLSAIGVWPLGSPDEQVRDLIDARLQGGR